MMKRPPLLAVTLALAAAAAATAPARSQPTADDFLPPVQGGPADVKAPDAVAVRGDDVRAPTAQDAINASVNENKRELREQGDGPEVGAKFASFPSGAGVVASGMATYRAMENPTATRIGKRQAYVVAFTQAKKNMAEFLGGLGNESKDAIRQQLANVETAREGMTNIATRSEESLAQAVDMMLRGFVVYEVQDDDKRNTVFVSIVSTPKTRGRFDRPAPNAVAADDLRDGINQVIAEVRSGLTPPVGGRIITMRKTGENAYVGFGSAVVRANDNAAVQAKLNLESQKVAKMKAQDALCGLIIGDRTSWVGTVRESMHDEVAEFEPILQGDPLAGGDQVRKLEAQRQSFVATTESSDAFQSARKGILPPGVTTKTWFTDDNAWAYGLAVYVPSMTNAAAQAAQEMRDATILQPAGPAGPAAGANTAKPGSGFTDEGNPNVQRPGKDVRPGPSGKGDDRGL